MGMTKELEIEFELSAFDILSGLINSNINEKAVILYNLSKICQKNKDKFDTVVTALSDEVVDESIHKDIKDMLKTIYENF